MDIKGKSKDRQPTSNISGSPKKGGVGKFGWGKGGLDDLNTVAVKDSHDPNYDSEEETTEEVVIQKVEVNSPIEFLIQEFLASGDVEETLKSFKELKLDSSSDQFVRKTILRAMEKQAYERELASKLLSVSYNNAITPEKISGGFQGALDSLEDIVLDTPEAVDILSKFIARAIFDEIIPPAFLKHAVAKSKLAEQCLIDANGLLNQPFRSERLSHIWGAGDLSSVKRLKEEINLMFEEYASSGDFSDADKTLRELNAHFFHPHLVKQGIVLSLTKEGEAAKKILSLLALFSQEGLVSKDHITEGFRLCSKNMDDIKLDIPGAPAVFEQIVKNAKQDGWLDSTFN